MTLSKLAALFLAAGTVWPAAPIAGDWTGTLKAGPAELRLLVHIKDEAGKLTATMDSIDQNANGMPVDQITLAGNKLSFDMNQISGSYSGVFDAGKKTIEGTWTQNGNSFPLNFAPYVEKPKKAYTGPAAKPSDVDGTWEGKIDAMGQSLRIVFHIKTQPDGELTATTDSPDQGGFGIPVTSVEHPGKKVKLVMKNLAAVYEGSLDEAKKTIAGTLTQNGNDMPLTLAKKAD